MKETRVSTFKVAATYIGTVVGAGFASGQETLQFFSVFGIYGLFGLVIVTFLFILFGYIIMDLGRRLKAQSHLKIVKFAGGRYVGAITDYIITFFLFGALTAMIAGAGAMFSQQFNFSPIWGNLLMATITCVTVLTGLKGVINSISFVVPFLISSVLLVSIVSIFREPQVTTVVQTAQESSLIRNWWWAAILYTSYNLVLAVAVLGPLGAKAKNKKSIIKGAIIGGLGLGIGATAIYLALTKNADALLNIEIPMAFIAGRISYAIQIVYIVVLLAEVYTTAVGSLYGFTARISDITSSNTKLLIVGVSISAFIASQFGFSNLVKYLYPLVGYGGIIMLVGLLYTTRTRRNRRDTSSF